MGGTTRVCQKRRTPSAVSSPPAMRRGGRGERSFLKHSAALPSGLLNLSSMSLRKEASLFVLSFLFILKVVIAKNQADDFILSSARVAHGTGKMVFVLATDNDFVAYSLGTITSKILPSGTGQLLPRRVLEKLEVCGKRYLIAYCLGGNDDMKVNLKGIGFGTALEWVKRLPLYLINAAQFAIDFPKQKKSDIVALFKEIDDLRALLLRPPQSVGEFDLEENNGDKSAIQLFLEESPLRRHLLERWNSRNIEVDRGDEDAAAIAAEYTPIRKRETRRKAIEATKLRPFSFPYRKLGGPGTSEVEPPQNRRKRKKVKEAKKVDGEWLFLFL